VPEDEVASVRVVETLARLRLERPLHQRGDVSRHRAVRAFDEFLTCGDRRKQSRESGGVRQQVKDRDAVPCRWRLGQMRLDEVVDLQSPALLEEQDRGGRELLRDRRHPEPCARTARDVPLDVCETVALAHDHVAAAGDEHGTGEGSVADVRLHDLIHASDILREADRGPTEPRQQHEGEPRPADARLHGTFLG
jgi:hypothetical protein